MVRTFSRKKRRMRENALVPNPAAEVGSVASAALPGMLATLVAPIAKVLIGSR